MNTIQKISLSLVITISLGLLVGIAAIVMRCFDVGVWKMALAVAVAVAGSGGIVSLVICKKDKGAVTPDERDKLIAKNAHLAGFGAVYLYMILLSILPLIIFGPAKTMQIPSTWSPALLIGAGFCQAYAQSIAFLFQYGWRDKGGEDNE